MILSLVWHMVVSCLSHMKIPWWMTAKDFRQLHGLLHTTPFSALSKREIAKILFVLCRCMRVEANINPFYVCAYQKSIKYVYDLELGTTKRLKEGMICMSVCAQCWRKSFMTLRVTNEQVYVCSKPQNFSWNALKTKQRKIFWGIKSWKEF